MKEEILKKLEEIKSSCLILDIETSAIWLGTDEPIDIFTHFEDYVKFAKTKWFGAYSYKHDKYIAEAAYGNEDNIKQLIEEHKYIIGFNNEEFDVPILYNNDLMPEKRMSQMDLLQILGSSTYKNHAGLSFKNRGMYMGLKFKNNSLRRMAEAMKLETQKGDVDYAIFHKNNWTQSEEAEIKKYLLADIEVTKLMFEKVWDYYLPFTEFLKDEDILNLSWIRSSIATLTYKNACKVLGVDDTYGEAKEGGSKEEMGGRVIEPKYEEARNVWYVDFTSLYPHIFAMFNLFAEVKPGEQINHPSHPAIWHGNDLFKVRGYYDISKIHPLSLDIAEKLKMRMEIKRQIKETGVPNPLEYAIKIFLNALYGAARSPIFEQIHTPNCGWDCCWLGQQINQLAEDAMKEFGFETIAGDTDSIFVVLKNKEKRENEETYVKTCLARIVKKIKDNVPFPCDTYNIDIEAYLDYVMWPFEKQPIEWDGNKEKLAELLLSSTEIEPMEIDQLVEHNSENIQVGHNVKNLKNRLIKINKGKKKNYMYIYKPKDIYEVKLMGLPIKKDNATLLGPKIYHDVLELQILKNMCAKFDKKQIDDLLDSYLQNQENLKLLAREYKVKPSNTYKNPSQIQAQISNGYFNGQGGVISLIKNKKLGRAGKTAKYATVEEIVEAKLKLKDLDLEKIQKELQPFIKNDNRI